MGLMDWYLGQKSKHQINQEIVGRLENKILEELTEAEKYTKLGEESLAEKHLKTAMYLKPIFGDDNREVDGFFGRVLIDYARKFYPVD